MALGWDKETFGKAGACHGPRLKRRNHELIKRMSHAYPGGN